MKLFQLFESKELNSELIWFQRYITDHDLKTQMEIKDNKIVFRNEGELVEWNAVEARRIRTEVLIDSAQCYVYADKVVRGTFELGEPAIAKEAFWSFCYAKKFKGRFELGEPEIAKHTDISYEYAKEVIKGKFELGEPAIALGITASYEYATKVIKAHFELGEPSIKSSPYYYNLYQKFLKTL